MAKTKSNPFIKMAVDTTMFGVGAGMIGNAASSFSGNPAAQGMVNAAGTVYAAKYLENVANTNLGTGKSKKRSGLL